MFKRRASVDTGDGREALTPAIIQTLLLVRADLEKSKYTAPDFEALRQENQDFLPRIRSSLPDTPGLHKVSISVMDLEGKGKDSVEATPRKSIKSRGQGSPETPGSAPRIRTLS